MRTVYQILLAVILIIGLIASATALRITPQDLYIRYDSVKLVIDCDDNSTIAFLMNGVAYEVPKSEWCDAQVGWLLPYHPEWEEQP